MIASIEKGRGTRGNGPVKASPETLRLLARGLATDLVHGAVDEAQATAFYEGFMRAAGYLEERPLTLEPAVEIEVADELTDEEIDARLVRYRSDPQTYISLMQGIQDPSRLSRAAKLAIIETVESTDDDSPRRRQG